MIPLLRLMIVLILGACASPAPFGSPEPGGSAAQTLAPQAVVGALAPQRLEPGACGLFLWTREPRRQLVFVGRPMEQVALMALDGRETELAGTASSAFGPMGLATLQSYRGPEGTTQLHLRLEPDARPGLTGGLVIPRATLRIEREDGWQQVLALGGLYACEE